MAVSDKSVELSENVLKALEDGQKAAMDAVKQFVDTLDKSLPALVESGEGPSKRHQVIDSALKMVDKLVATQVEFLRTVVHAAGDTLK